MTQDRQHRHNTGKYELKWKHLGLAIREKMQERQIKQYELADKIGVSAAHISGVMAGDQFSLDVLFAIEEALDFEFVRLTNERSPEERRAERIGNLAINLMNEFFE